MPALTPFSGELQGQVMAALWRIETGTVDKVRAALPQRYRGAYTTTQTVLNRLAERHLVARRREGNVIVYRPRITEAQYLTRTIETTLAGASADARQVVLAQLIGGLEGQELSELQRLAREVAEKRGAR